MNFMRFKLDSVDSPMYRNFNFEMHVLGGIEKNSCSSKFMQLMLLNRLKAK